MFRKKDYNQNSTNSENDNIFIDNTQGVSMSESDVVANKDTQKDTQKGTEESNADESLVSVSDRVRQPTSPRGVRNLNIRVTQPHFRLQQAKSGGKVLNVGSEIHLKGEIGVCDKIVIQGVVEADIKDIHLLEVLEGGIFKGNAVVDNAEIAGELHGNIEVAGLLKVSGTAKIKAKVKYGVIEVDQGANIKGNVSHVSLSHEKPSTTKPAKPAKPRKLAKSTKSVKSKKKSTSKK